MKQIYQRVAAQTGYSQEQVKSVVEHTFAWLRHQMSEVTSDKILFTYFGTFKLLKSKLNKALKAKNLSKRDRAFTEQLLDKYFKKD